jgi:hypothetical protein
LVWATNNGGAVMKKYNTPELKVSMFNSESITAADVSTTLATYNYYQSKLDRNNVIEKDWTQLNISF